MSNLLQPKILDNLGLLPKINSLFLNRNNGKIFASIDLEIDTIIKDNKNPWIFKPEILQMIDFSIIFCFNQNLQLHLLKNNEEIYSTIKNNENLTYKTSGVDYIQRLEKLQSSKLNISKKNTIFSEIVSTGINYNFNIELENINHLSVFIGISLNKEKLAERFSVNLGNINKTFGTFFNEIFIDNGKYVNSKLNDITIFKSKDKFSFNKSSITKFLESYSNKGVSKNNNKIYFSEMFSGINEKNNIVSFFFLDVKNLYRDNCIYPFFFENKNFEDIFFRNSSDYNPYYLKIIKKNKYNQSSLYENYYNDNIDNDNIVFRKVKFDDKVLFCLIDKDISTNYKDFEYEIEFHIEDKTLLYLNKLKNQILTLSDKMNEIYNIATINDFYIYSLNKFSDKFLITLSKNNINIENIIIEIANILNQFSSIDEFTVKNIKNIANTKFYNFEILDSLLDITSFLKSEITKIKYSSNNLLNLIKVSKSFRKDLNLINTNYFEKIIEIQKDFPVITNKDLYDRSSIEISKFYNINEIDNNSKFTYFSPIMYKGEIQNIIQNQKFNDLDFNLYNEFYINYFISKIYKGNYEKLSRQEKLLLILENWGINISLYKENVEKNAVNQRKPQEFILKKDIRVKYDENILFNVFIDIVIKNNPKIFSFSHLNPDDNDTKVYKLKENIPLQVDSVINGFKNNAASINDANNISEILKNKRNFFALFSNYKNLYKIQYLDEDTMLWKDFSDRILFSNFSKYLCRYVSYLDFDMQIDKINDINFNKYNEYFILENTENIIDRNIFIQKQNIKKLSSKEKVQIQIDKNNKSNIIKANDLKSIIEKQELENNSKEKIMQEKILKELGNKKSEDELKIINKINDLMKLEDLSKESILKAVSQFEKMMKELGIEKSEELNNMILELLKKQESLFNTSQEPPRANLENPFQPTTVNTQQTPRTNAEPVFQSTTSTTQQVPRINTQSPFQSTTTAAQSTMNRLR